MAQVGRLGKMSAIKPLRYSSMQLNKTRATALMFALIAPLSIAPLSHADEPLGRVYTTIAEQPVSAKDREVADLFDRWNAALKTGDSQKVAALYAPDAILQPTVSNEVRTTPESISDYFDHFLANKPVGQINYRLIRHMGADSAMDSGVYTFNLTAADGSTRRVQARYSFIYERVNGEWKIINHHSSAMPQVHAAL